MYLKRGYKEKKTCKIQAENGDILVYDEMEKFIVNQQGVINYNRKIFLPSSNTDNENYIFIISRWTKIGM